MGGRVGRRLMIRAEKSSRNPRVVDHSERYSDVAVLRGTHGAHRARLRRRHVLLLVVLLAVKVGIRARARALEREKERRARMRNEVTAESIAFHTRTRFPISGISHKLGGLDVSRAIDPLLHACRSARLTVLFVRARGGHFGSTTGLLLPDYFPMRARAGARVASRSAAISRGVRSLPRCVKSCTERGVPPTPSPPRPYVSA